MPNAGYGALRGQTIQLIERQRQQQVHAGLKAEEGIVKRAVYFFH